MKIAVTSQGPELSSMVDPRFGRAACFIIYDTADKSFEALDNSQNAGAAQGAGVQAAQWVAQYAVDVVVSGNMGPKAFEVLKSAGIRIVSYENGTVAEAIELVDKGELQTLDAANTRGHWK
jgi:predicted Fe-Mo cluster-binding NifX family protein